MKHTSILVVMVAVFALLASTVAIAQQPTHPHDAAQQAPASRPATPTQGPDVHMAQHMELCRQMMMGHTGPRMMGGGMMGMPMMMGDDPKQQAEMLAMRGEMMKAMGEIMMKYAQRAQSSK